MIAMKRVAAGVQFACVVMSLFVLGFLTGCNRSSPPKSAEAVAEAKRESYSGIYTRRVQLETRRLVLRKSWSGAGAPNWPAVDFGDRSWGETAG